jgi:hypothetical protein
VCPEKTTWNGLTCARSADYEKPPEKDDSVDYGGMSPKQPPCPEGQVRDAKGVCGCPPYLEAVIETGKTLCCLTPCPAGQKRENAQCVPDPKAVTLASACPAGWSGIPPACCAPGTVFQNGRCQRPASATPVPLTPTVKCEGGMVGTPPNCTCPDNTQFDGRRCAPIVCPQGTTGVYPTCCGPDTVYRDGRCVAVTQPPPLRCTGGMVPVGTPPKCECPDGTRFDPRRRQCTAIEQPLRCTGGMVPVGTPPRCECPDGTRFDPRQRQCTAIEQPLRCTGGMVPVGTPPKCECPDGTRFDPRRRQCTAIEQPLRCTGGMVPVGTPPKCECPSGMRFDSRQRRCAPERCPLGMSGVPPTCCAPGTRYVDGRCEKPTPTCTGGMVLVGTPPKCECPAGTKLLPRYRRCVKETTQPPPRTCPPGYRVLDKPNRYGAYCEIIPIACTGGRVPVGSPPKCECPAGTTPRYGRCIPRREPAPTPTPTAKCQPYQIGTPPNCRCPPRLTGPKCDQPVVN